MLPHPEGHCRRRISTRRGERYYASDDVGGGDWGKVENWQMGMLELPRLSFLVRQPYLVDCGERAALSVVVRSIFENRGVEVTPL